MTCYHILCLGTDFPQCSLKERRSLSLSDPVMLAGPGRRTRRVAANRLFKHAVLVRGPSHTPTQYTVKSFLSFVAPCRAFNAQSIPTIPSDSEEEEHYEMVQAYHAVPVSVEYEDVDGDNGRPAENEGSALLGSRASGVGLAKSEVQKEGHATLSSSIVNLSNTIIGSGACPLHHSPYSTVVCFSS